ncbi:reverse transcriptase domain-containing protein [Tanacetum coccineum]
MRTQSAGWLVLESRGRGIGNDQGLGDNGGVEGVNGNVEGVNNLLPAIIAKVGNQGNVGNQNGNVVNENVQENVKNVLVNGNQIRTLSWEVAVSMSYNDFKLMIIEEFYPSHEMQKLETKLWNHAMVVAGHATYTNRFHELARMVAVIKPKTIQKAMQIFGALTDEAVRNKSIKKVEKRGNLREPSKDKNGRDDNKRTRIGNAFASTTNLVGRENMGAWPKCTTCNSYHAPRGPCRTCFNYNRPGHLANDYRGAPRNVNPVIARNLTIRACYECGSIDHVRSACPRLNREQGPEGNHPNQVFANNRGKGRGNQGNQARGRAFMLGAEEAR